MFDFNNADKQREFDTMPDGTIVPVHLTLRPGGAGDGNWLKRSRNGDCLMLDCEFTVIDGEFAKRKFWSLMTVEGETEGQQRAADISRSRLRGMLESAKGIEPSDESETAQAARRVTSFGDFDGLRFWVKVGYESPKDNYKAKNTLAAIITPDKKEWSKLEQVAKKADAAQQFGNTPKPAATGTVPPWAA